MLRELEKELQSAALRQCRKLEWSAAESAILGQISSILDRKHDFWTLYDDDTVDVKTRLKVSAEVRLLEQAADRLVRMVKTDLPAPSDDAVEYDSTANTSQAAAAASIGPDPGPAYIWPELISGGYAPKSSIYQPPKNQPEAIALAASVAAYDAALVPNVFTNIS